MKGIVLAGGSGTRLLPTTLVVNKHLLPIYDKPMVYYPLSLLMLAGLRDILIISTPHDVPIFTKLLGDGSKWGVNLSYAIQSTPRGIADAFIVGRKYIGDDSVALILGDNIFYGNHLPNMLRAATKNHLGATVFAYQVLDPQRYGVVTFSRGKVIKIEEKPRKPKSNWAVTGLYFYDNDVVEIAQSILPSPRGELEITDIHNAYLKQDALKIEWLGRGMAWLDTGTPSSLLEAAEFIRTIEHRQGLKVGSLEEVAFNNGWIDAQNLEVLGQSINNDYGKYLLQLANVKSTSYPLVK